MHRISPFIVLFIVLHYPMLCAQNIQDYDKCVHAVVAVVGQMCQQDSCSAEDYGVLADRTIALAQVGAKLNEGHESQDVVQIQLGVLEDGLAAVKAGYAKDQKNPAWTQREATLKKLRNSLKPLPKRRSEDTGSDGSSGATGGTAAAVTAHSHMQTVGGKSTRSGDVQDADLQAKLDAIRANDKPGVLFQALQDSSPKKDKPKRDW